MALTATSVSTLVVRSGIVTAVIRCIVVSVVVVIFVFRAGIVIGVLRMDRLGRILVWLCAMSVEIIWTLHLSRVCNVFEWLVMKIVGEGCILIMVAVTEISAHIVVLGNKKVTLDDECVGTVLLLVRLY